MRRGLTWFLLALLFGACAGLVVRGEVSHGALLALAASLLTSSLLYVGAVVDAGLLARGMARRGEPAAGPGAPLSALFVVVGFVLPLGAALWLRSERLEAFRVPTSSMAPTIEPGDRILVDKLAILHGDPRRGDVVVFRDPAGSGRAYVKRVLAVGGDRVEIRDGEILVNGAALPRSSDPSSEGVAVETNGAHRYRVVPGPSGDVPERQLRHDEYFLVGDRRRGSLDSRTLGPIRRDALIGTVRWRFWPWGRFGLVE
jgi:signal peptidase I